MKLKRAFNLALVLMICSSASIAQSPRIETVEDYNKLLPHWGVSWSPGAKSINGYYQTFYTGFVMRSESPERIHVRTSRGNQTRVSVILDEQTVSDYLFDLAKRYSFYKKMTTGAKPQLDINPANSKSLPQLAYYNQILESPRYGILEYVERASQGRESQEAIYKKSLETLTALNPGRVFALRLDLNAEFTKWKTEMRTLTGGDASRVMSSPAAVITAINGLVFGRVNYADKPSAQVLAQLQTALTAALQNSPDEVFVPAALELFKSVTGSKYQIKVLNAQGQFEPALKCSGTACTLTYTEFTTIYPTGSMEATTSDEYGNRINSFATPGLWQFLSRSGKHDVDNIRNEPYYGWAPKMDFEAIGNGFHNPAVRFWDPSKALKTALGINPGHNTLWAVKRGGVSHGCLRVPLGHLWEMRQIFPVENDKATKIMFFGNNSQDFDVYDINGDGQLEVMGVQYLISYGLQGADGLARREGSGFEVNEGRKLDFYTNLYGARNVFRVDNNGTYTFQSPRISFPSYLDLKRKNVTARPKLQGDYPLYEQAYEKDKVQFYAVGEMSETNKRVIRLMGRIKGCAPSSNKQECGEAAFDQEAKGLVR